MILYHGSNVFIQNIDLNKCKPFKDFGRGFYCTTIKDQAELMAARVSAIFGGAPRVTQFELDESLFTDSEIKTRRFIGPSRDWAMFVLNNRNKFYNLFDSKDCNHDNKYDLVVGPIANDDLVLLFRTYTNGIIDLDTLIKGMEYKKLTDQYSFHTQKALQFLISNKEVY